MKYLVVGAGGAGGVLGASLAQAGYDVTMIARGGHLRAIKEKGLIIHNLWDDSEITVPVKAVSADEYVKDNEEKADVILVCVKGYSIPEIVPFLRSASTPETVILPILNIYTTGETLRKALPDRYVIDGCIYVSSNIEEYGKILKHAKVLRVFFGPAKDQESRPVLKQLEQELNDGGVRGGLSENIRRDALQKFCYVSPIGAAGLYYNANAGSFQKEGEERELYIGMMKEIVALADAMGCPFETDVVAANLNILDHQPPMATTSMQRDILAGGPSEIEGLVYEVPETGKQYGLEMPLYQKVSDELKARYS